MIKISALNKECEEESRSEEEVTKEALEQIALQQYAKALELHRKGNLLDATQLLKDLLETELLEAVKKPEQGDKLTEPLFNLKYLCYKNLGSMLSATGADEPAIEAYCAASELDDSDVTLWHRLGVVCMRAKRYEMALHAFQCGADRNPKHWPCLDKIVTLLFGLDYKEECISVIYDTLELDPGYLRGLVYRKYIFTTYSYIKEFMQYLNPIYKWSEKEMEEIDEDRAQILLKEAKEIQEIYLEQQRTEQFKYILPILKLSKPITKFTWESVGNSLVHMHKHITENFFSHACYIELLYETEERKEQEVSHATKEIKTTDYKSEDSVAIPEKNSENGVENDINEILDKEKLGTDLEKIESDVEIVVVEPAAENLPEPKKKTAVRRRGSALSCLELWEWCNKRRSGRKKPVNRQDHLDDNIYDTLRRMVPLWLIPEAIQNKEDETNQNLPQIDLSESQVKEENNKKEFEEYFGSENEQLDVKQFLCKYTDTKKDIIEILKDYLSILAEKWKLKWPESVSKIFVEANKCYSNHIEIPSCTDNNHEELFHYVIVNLLTEEFTVNEKLNLTAENKPKHEFNVIETIGVSLSLKPHIFANNNILEFVLRYLWLKVHIHMLNKSEDLALDSLYQLLYEFEAMGEHSESYNLDIVNFTFKPIIKEIDILAYIKFLERNKKLSTVMELYDQGNYEEVLTITIDSFEHCKNMARKQEEEMSLDFAVQLSLILDSFWALDKVDSCFKWSLICLHEALNHFFRFTSGSSDYKKWTLAVVKVLCCMEHILTNEGLTCLEAVTQKELGQGLEDLIRVIGHQVETNAAEMPLGTVVPWIILHYILQREEDHGRGRTGNDKEKDSCDDVPNPLMILFIAHEQLGNHGWCCNSEGKLLYFILDTVVPRLRSPSLSKSLEQVCQYMEQCVFCLFGHPGRKNKLKHLTDHNVTPHILDWKRAQQVYEIFRPPSLPALEGKISGISADTEQLFLRILDLLPSDIDPQKYMPDIEKYIKGIENKLPTIPPLLPYKMKDIYFLLGDYYFKKEEGKLAIKYNMLDVIVNNDRLESWAEISLAKAVNLERILNSCKNLNNEREFLNPAKSIIRCFQRSLELDPTHCNMWIEYGMFVYTVHSFCSRLLKQASESLSMEDFEALEKQKEDMLDTTQKCFMAVLGDLNNSDETEKANEDSWLHYYMLGKVAEKRNKPPSEYLNYYMQGVQSLQETDATYPLKINYSSPTHLCIQVLELHYRIHASILKYIEQHENKPIPAAVGKVFANCIEEWKKGPFTKKTKKDGFSESESEPKGKETVLAGNIFKRSISDAGEDDTGESKKMKLEIAAAKVKRSASYDTEMLNKEQSVKKAKVNSGQSNDSSNIKTADNADSKKHVVGMDKDVLIKNTSELKRVNDKRRSTDKASSHKNKQKETDKKSNSSISSSSSSSSDSSSSDSSSNSSTESSRDSDLSSKSSNNKPLSEEEIMNIVSACLDALEDCASRFPPHYKAIYRLAHYHFYYKKGKNIERCRDLMLSTFTSRCGQKLGGLFSERKHSNFFNNIWKIPHSEVERAGGFVFHMSRSVQLTMEILKEIDDHKTLLDLSLHLQRIPEAGKKYLRDSDREELAQQAFSLCVQSLKGQLLKFSQQADLKSNDVERQALKSLMLDIYRAYQRAQKQPNAKQFTNLLVDGYKLVSTTPISENMNLVDLSMKFCQSLIQTLKQQATQASLDKNQNAHKKQTSKAAAAAVVESTKVTTPTTTQARNDPKAASVSTSTLPKMSAHDMTAAFQNFLPVMNDSELSRQTAAALSYLNNISALAGYTQLQNTLQSSLQNTLQNSFQAEFYRQFISQSLTSYNLPPPKKQKRGPKSNQAKAKSFVTPVPPISKSSLSTAISHHKSVTSPLTPSMGTVLPSLPASMTANLSAFGGSSLSSSLPNSNTQNNLPVQAHMSSTSKMSTSTHPPTKPLMPHQQCSPGKTLQEKLAERQKNLPTISKNSKEISASISKLPSSLTITKSSVPKHSGNNTKKGDSKKSLPFNDVCLRPKPISSDEVIVLDDD